MQFSKQIYQNLIPHLQTADYLCAIKTQLNDNIPNSYDMRGTDTAGISFSASAERPGSGARAIRASGGMHSGDTVAIFSRSAFRICMGEPAGHRQNRGCMWLTDNRFWLISQVYFSSFRRYGRITDLRGDVHTAPHSTPTGN